MKKAVLGVIGIVCLLLVMVSLAMATLSPPSNLNADPGNEQVKLTWDTVGGATGYDVYRSTTNASDLSGFVKLTATPLTNPSYLSTGLTNDRTYWYKVSSVDGSGDSSLSNSVEVSPIAPPATPPWVNAIPVSGTVMKVDWGLVSNTTSYTLEKSADNTNWTPFATITERFLQTTQATDLTHLTTYYFRVRANNEGGSSAWTDSVSAKTTLKSPTLSGTTGNGPVTLTWDVIPGATGYVVGRKGPGDDIYHTVGGTSSNNLTSYTAEGLTNGTTYSFCVNAINDTPREASAESNSVTLTPSPKPVDRPNTPTDLYVSTTSDTVINVDWHLVDGATSYTVEKSTDNLTWTFVANATHHPLDPSASGLSPLTTYYFRVRANNEGGSSDWTPSLSARTKLKTATLTGTAGNGQVTVSWDAIPGATGYFILRRDPGETNYDKHAVRLDGIYSTSYTSTGLTNGSDYSFVVYGIDATPAEEGIRSQPLVLTPVSNSPTATPTAVPTATPTAVPTATPTAVPTATPTAVPTATPTAVPTATPTATPLPILTVEDARVLEGDQITNWLRFRVSLSQASSQSVRFSYVTEGDTATADDDFVQTKGSMTLFPGEVSEFITVAVRPDTVVEPDETLGLVIYSPIGAQISGGTSLRATGTIINDDVTATSTPVPTATSTPVPTATSTPVPTATSTPVPTATPIPTVTPAPTATPAPVALSGKIVFVSNRDGNDEIYISNVDGTNLTRLTKTVGAEAEPTLSPDGTKIAFTSDRDGRAADLWTMNVDGTNQKLIVSSNLIEASPCWSPNGTRILYSQRSTSATRVRLINADGTGSIALSNSLWRESDASWSPDGSKIVFTSNRDGNRELYVMNADGSGVVRLTQDSADDCQPHFSPDGAKIAWTSTRGGTSHVFVMNADGTGVAPLSSGTADDFDPFWSPDGTRVGFSSARSAGQTLWTTPLGVPGAGTAPAQLLPLNGNAHWGAWETGTVAPNPNPTPVATPPTFAGQIVFVSTRDGNEEIYRMNADGTNQTRLTFDAPSTAYPANLDEAPSLSADGTKIAWASWRGGAGPAIWVMNADGSSPYQVATNGYEPVWTPDGNLIYAQNSGTQSAKIYRISPNGQNNTYLVDGFHPRQSADGATMIFTRRPSSGDDQIWLSSSNGSNARNLAPVTTRPSRPQAVHLPVSSRSLRFWKRLRPILATSGR